ncbi:hypothetical protein COOONC_19732 [Cooperia oncophora]
MKFAILFFIALLALALARPHSSDSSDSDEHPHRGKPHHKHHHRHTRRPPPPPPQTVAPVTTEESPVVTDAPSDAPSSPTEIGPIVTTGYFTTELAELTSAAPEGTAGTVSIAA